MMQEKSCGKILQAFLQSKTGLGFKPLPAAGLALIGNPALASGIGLLLERHDREAVAAILRDHPASAGLGHGRMPRHVGGLAGLPGIVRPLRELSSMGFHSPPAPQFTE